MNKVYSILDDRVRIEITDEGARAYLVILPVSEDKQLPSPEEVFKVIDKIGIKNPIKEVVYEALEDKDNIGRPMLMAKGTPPTKGKDAFFIYKFGTLPEEQQIDVFPGQLLAVKRPPTKGKPGISVTGKKIPALLGKDIQLKPGKNVFVSNDGTKVFALERGKVKWKGNNINVEKVLEISGDVDKDVGDISFQGRVEVSGEVKDGFAIKAKGDVNIDGDVGACVIETSGDIYIKGKVNGKNKARLWAEGNISAEAIREAYIRAKRDVIVENGIEDSIVVADNIYIDKGYIIGGKISVNSNITVDRVGNENHNKITEISMDSGGKFNSLCVYPKTKITIGKDIFEIDKEPVTNFEYSGKPDDKKLQKIGEHPEAEIHKKDDRIASRINKIFVEQTFSVLLRSNSILDAKEIGARLLGLTPSEVDSQIIGKSKEDNMLIIRIFKLGVIGPWMDTEGKGMLVDIEYDADGRFEFMNTETGLFLTVVPPLGKGKPVTVEEVLEYIKKKEFGRVDEKIVRKTVEEALNIPVKIGKRRRIPHLDGTFRIEVLPNFTKAVIFIVPPKPGGVPIQYEEIMEALKEEGVVCGIKEDVIREVIDPNYRPCGPVTIAEEIPPKQGTPAKIEFKFRTHKKIVLTEDEQGRVDFKRLNLIENVKAGQVLAVKIPPGEGIPGKLLNGKEIPGRPGPDVKMPAGRNVSVSTCGTQLRATMNGHVLLVNGKVNVEDMIVFPGNIDYSTGSVYFLGSVEIKGDVLDDFEVEATGDILIRGSVGKCFISAGGSIAIGEGVKGKNAARLFAGQHVIAKYIEYAMVEARESVRVLEEILHSTVEAGDSILMEGRKRAVIIGGLLRAANEIRVKELGCNAGVKTIVEVGGTPRTRQELATLENIYKQDLNTYKQLELNIAHLRRQQEKGKLSLEGELRLRKLLWRHKRLTMRLHKYTNQKEALEMRIKRASSGVVNVSGTLHPGVVITAKTATKAIKEQYEAVSIGFDSSVGIKICPYGTYREKEPEE